MTDFIGGAIHLSMQKSCLDGWRRVRDSGHEPVTLSREQYDEMVNELRHHRSQHFGAEGHLAGLRAAMRAMPLEVRKALAESIKANFMHAYAEKTVKLGASWDFNQPKEYAHLLGELNGEIKLILPESDTTSHIQQDQASRARR
jgi:hypothetical protein